MYEHKEETKVQTLVLSLLLLICLLSNIVIDRACCDMYNPLTMKRGVIAFMYLRTWSRTWICIVSVG